MVLKVQSISLDCLQSIFLSYFLLGNSSKSVPGSTHNINHMETLLLEELHTPRLIYTDQSLVSKLAIFSWNNISKLVEVN